MLLRHADADDHTGDDGRQSHLHPVRLNMQMTFRWFGDDDAIPLAHIRQIPGVTGVVSALYNVPVGDVWPLDRIADLASRIDEAGLSLAVVESIPVHEDIKLGRPTRDRFVDQYAESVRNMGEAGVQVLCYNFMPIFDWMRTDLALPQPDGSTALAYDDAALSRIDLSRGTGDLPGWATAYDAASLHALRHAYEAVDAERLWENLEYFWRESSRPRKARAFVWQFIRTTHRGHLRSAANCHECREPRSSHATRRLAGEWSDVLHRIARRRSLE